MTTFTAPASDNSLIFLMNPLYPHPGLGGLGESNSIQTSDSRGQVGSKGNIFPQASAIRLGRDTFM